MFDDDRSIGEPERARGIDVFEIPGPQKFRSHDMHERYPGKQQKYAEQHEEARGDDRGNNDQEIEMRERRPYFNEALKNEVRPAAKITLHRASRDPHDRGNPRECKAEQEREAKAIEQSGEDIAALIVGSEPVPFNIPAIALGLSLVEAFRGGAALSFAQHPGRR